MADLFFVLIVLAHRRNTESFTRRDAMSSPLPWRFTHYLEDITTLEEIHTWRKYFSSEAKRHLRPASDTGLDQTGPRRERGRIA